MPQLMDKPMDGWQVLVDLLKPGGLMKIGLYSELARKPIHRVREKISSLRLRGCKTDIREFRGVLVESHGEDRKHLIESGDFFSLSAFRDLIFHVQEHRFTLPQIRGCLNELGLKFCGFEQKDAVSKFRALYGREAGIYDLLLWHQYEESHPRTFAGMYQFWCQKL